jgi:hypothetical protein
MLLRVDQLPLPPVVGHFLAESSLVPQCLCSCQRVSLALPMSLSSRPCPSSTFLWVPLICRLWWFCFAVKRHYFLCNTPMGSLVMCCWVTALKTTLVQYRAFEIHLCVTHISSLLLFKSLSNIPLCAPTFVHPFAMSSTKLQSLGEQSPQDCPQFIWQTQQFGGVSRGTFTSHQLATSWRVSKITFRLDNSLEKLKELRKPLYLQLSLLQWKVQIGTSQRF